MAPELEDRPKAPAWLPDVALLSGLNLLAGVWLVVAPWVLGYSGRDPRWNDVVLGIVVALIAFARLGAGVRGAWLSAANVLAGAWIVVATFTIDASGAAKWNDVVVGSIVVLLALASASATRPGVDR